MPGKCKSGKKGYRNSGRKTAATKKGKAAGKRTATRTSKKRY